MVLQRTMRFSDMKLDKDTIAFEREQLELYTGLVDRHPGNELYKKAQSQLASMLEDHEKQLWAMSAKEEPARGVKFPEKRSFKTKRAVKWDVTEAAYLEKQTVILKSALNLLQSITRLICYFLPKSKNPEK